MPDPDNAGVRASVRRLAALGTMPNERDQPPAERVIEFQEALEALPRPLSDDEAALLLDTFPAVEGGLFGLEWSLLHAIETAPFGPALSNALDDRSWWVRHIREVAESSGVLDRGHRP